jgi:hypothetical protein
MKNSYVILLLLGLTDKINGMKSHSGLAEANTNLQQSTGKAQSQSLIEALTLTETDMSAFEKLVKGKKSKSDESSDDDEESNDKKNKDSDDEEEHSDSRAQRVNGRDKNGMYKHH